MITRCSACPSVNLCIPPDGPEGDILFIGEAPGYNENKKNRVFIGKTGDEVNQHYLPVAGLWRKDVCFTNAIRCLPTSAGGKLKSDRAKDISLLESCAGHHLYPLIERMAPTVIVPMGAFACRAIYGPGFDLDIRHGIPEETPFGVMGFPMYHPALGIYEPKKMLYIRTDWHRFKSFLSGTFTRAVDGRAGQEDYQEVTHESELQEIHPDRPLAADTESERGGKPHCLTYSQQPGRGRLIRASRPDLLSAFQHQIRRGRGKVLFHNWLYDWPVTEEMGCGFPYDRIVDTMSLVFHLGNLPQGLKALAFRELGMVMQDFDDLVSPYSSVKVLDYYRKAAEVQWEKPAEQCVMDEKTGLWKMYKPQSMSTKFKRFFTDYRKNPDKDVFGMFEDNWVDHQSEIEAAAGEYPGKCISHVPFEKTLHYACRDADALIRLYPILTAMRKMVRKKSQEWWRIAS